MTLLAGFKHETCGVEFELKERVRGFATIPAQRERIICPKCGIVLDLYLWWPSINGRRNCAIIIDWGRCNP